MRYRLSMLIALLASACTFTSQENSLQGQFNPPLFYPSWHVNKYTARSGIDACSISSGNGLTVTLGKMAGGIDVVVASNHPMAPGTVLTVDVAGERFEAYDTYFSKEVGRKLADALSRGGKAYLDWSETNGPEGGQRIHTQNILRLDDYKAKIKQCEDSLR